MSPETAAALEGVDVAKGAAKVQRILGMVVNVSADVPKDAVILVGAPSLAAPNATPLKVRLVDHYNEQAAKVPAGDAMYGKPPKKPRSDKGTKRPKANAVKVEQPASGGTLTHDQRLTLVSLIRDAQDAKSEHDGATARLYNADVALQRYLDSLVASPGGK